jgi:hypothetical protein
VKNLPLYDAWVAEPEGLEVEAAAAAPEVAAFLGMMNYI